VTAAAEPPNLRSDPAALAALVQATARHLQINEAFVEKDFWAIEVLRVCAQGDEIDVRGTMMPVTAIFKGAAPACHGCTA